MLRLAFAVFFLFTVQAHTFTVLLKPQNTDSLTELLYNVSTPRHPQYQRFLSPDRLHDWYAPSESDLSLLSLWLYPADLSPYKGRRWRVDVLSDTPAPTTIPAHLSGLVHRILSHTNRTRTPRKRVLRSMTQLSQAAYNVTSAQTLCGLYQASNPASYTAVNSVRQLEVTVIAEDGDTYNPADLASYGKLMGSQSGWQAVNNIALDTTIAGQETSLDMQAITLMSPRGTNLSYWGHYNEGNDWPEIWPSEILSSPQPWPLSTTVSWGGADSSSSEQASGEHYLQLLALGGVTMFASSGDDGALGSNNPNCISSLGLDPSYPSSSPYVTAVGATEFVPQTNAFYAGTPVCDGVHTMQQLNTEYQFTGGEGYFACIQQTFPEQAASFVNSGFMSGGGFSSVYPQPSYQQAAVSGYLNNPTIVTPYPTLFNPANRAVPDIAVYGGGILVIDSAQLIVEGGTSLSSPLAAALFTPLQDISLKYTGVGLGWLNPLLYLMWQEDPSLFHDVTLGNNNGSRNSPNCTLGGYSAATGWDPVTGLGTPNIAAMSNWLIALYSPSSSSSSSSSTASVATLQPSLTVLPPVITPNNTLPVTAANSGGTALSTNAIVGIAVASVVIVIGCVLLSAGVRYSRR